MNALDSSSDEELSQPVATLTKRRARGLQQDPPPSSSSSLGRARNSLGRTNRSSSSSEGIIHYCCIHVYVSRHWEPQGHPYHDNVFTTAKN